MMSWILDWLPWWTWYAVAGSALFFTAPWWMPFARIVWGLLPSWARAAIITIVVALGAWLAGRNRGASNERARQKAKDAAAVKTRTETDNAIDHLDPATRKRRLDKWLRD